MKEHKIEFYYHGILFYGKMKQLSLFELEEKKFADLEYTMEF